MRAFKELPSLNCSLLGHLLLPSHAACKYERDVNPSRVLFVKTLPLILIITNHSLASTAQWRSLRNDLHLAGRRDRSNSTSARGAEQKPTWPPCDLPAPGVHVLGGERRKADKPKWVCTCFSPQRGSLSHLSLTGVRFLQPAQLPGQLCAPHCPSQAVEFCCNRSLIC